MAGITTQFGPMTNGGALLCACPHMRSAQIAWRDDAQQSFVRRLSYFDSRYLPWHTLCQVLNRHQSTILNAITYGLRP